MFGKKMKVNEDELRRELEAKVATHVNLPVRIPMDTMVSLKKLSLETGISVSKIANFLIDTGLQKLDKHSAATIG